MPNIIYFSQVHVFSASVTIIRKKKTTKKWNTFENLSLQEQIILRKIFEATILEKSENEKQIKLVIFCYIRQFTPEPTVSWIFHTFFCLILIYANKSKPRDPLFCWS